MGDADKAIKNSVSVYFRVVSPDPLLTGSIILIYLLTYSRAETSRYRRLYRLNTDRLWVEHGQIMGLNTDRLWVNTDRLWVIVMMLGIKNGKANASPQRDMPVLTILFSVPNVVMYLPIF